LYRLKKLLFCAHCGSHYPKIAIAGQSWSGLKATSPNSEWRRIGGSDLAGMLKTMHPETATGA